MPWCAQDAGLSLLELGKVQASWGEPVTLPCSGLVKGVGLPG